MAYDQHTQYQPPPRAYYTRQNHQPSRAEDYNYNQYPDDYGYGTGQYAAPHGRGRGNQITEGYHGGLDGFARQQTPQRGYPASNNYHGGDGASLEEKDDRLRAARSKPQPIQADRIAGGSRRAQTEDFTGTPRSQPVGPQGRSKSRQPNDRIPLPPSPQKSSWDNPFPTFPNAKQKSYNDHADKLQDNVAAISLQDGPRRSNDSRSERPKLAASKGSYDSSRSQERPQGAPRMNSQEQRNHDAQPNDFAEQQANPGRGWDVYTHDYHRNVVQGPGPVYHERFRRQNAHTAQSRPSDQRHIEPRPAESSHTADGTLCQGPQRSMTMPAELGSGKPSPRPQAAYPGQISWQEPGPTAGYHGPDIANFVPPRPATAGGSRPTRSAQSHSYEASNDYFPRSAITPYRKGIDQYPTNGVEKAHSGRSSPHSRQESVGEVLDSYYETSNDDYGVPGSKHFYSGVTEEAMPNFETAVTSSSTPRRGMKIDQHLKPRPNGDGAHSLPGYHNRGDMASFVTQPFHSTSRAHQGALQPDLQGHSQTNQNGSSRAVFEMVGDVPGVSTTPEHIGTTASQHSGRYGSVAGHCPQPKPNALGAAGYSYSRSGNSTAELYGSAQRQRLPLPQWNASAESYRSSSGHSGLQQRPAAGPVRQLAADTPRTEPAQRGVPSRGTPSPANQASPRSSPSTGKTANPDALPAHPTPVRAGLIPDSVASQAIQSPSNGPYGWGGQTSQHQVLSQQLTSSSNPQEKREFIPVTHEELNRLKRVVKTNPSDSKTQLLLAQKWVEAALVLADEGGRADPKTRNKNRERYIFDAHKIVKKLVSNGYPDAMFYLADCTGRGLLGLEPDTKEAFNLYQSAAKAGHARSAYRTAVCCEMGQEEGGGTRRDPVKAVQWYKRAATLGDTPAMYKMGMILLKGLLGQTKNPREAVTWLKRAADRADEENPHALHELGLLYETANGNDSIVRDEKYSMQLFTKAADLGYKFSQFRLGCAYEYGSIGCRIDPRRSIAWYSRAAVQEEHQSELALSGWYLTGSEGVLQQSDTEAYLWARKAAQAGLAKAEYAMGYFTEVGIGAPSNIADAQRWYQRAASQNYPKARERLEALRSGGANSQKSRERISRSKVNKQNEGECIVM
ncbi:MAG: hypothetical protein M1835_006020 [Candelina submexicana]|nr:MAG: hypothetical protein M1835_006020 [Candelina submexicana]